MCGSLWTRTDERALLLIDCLITPRGRISLFNRKTVVGVACTCLPFGSDHYLILLRTTMVGVLRSFLSFPRLVSRVERIRHESLLLTFLLLPFFCASAVSLH